MKIAVLSGKGGTGKTFVSVNLAYVQKDSVYIDCDIEEPNGRLFLKPEISEIQKVYTMVPVVDNEKCNACRECLEFCKFNALAFIKNKVKVFNELCHGCDGCVLLCQTKAMSKSKRYIGNIEKGVVNIETANTKEAIANKMEVITGILNIGEATGVPIIRDLLADLPNDKDVIIDCPPGSACTVMESIKDSDFCLMVAEPTKFGEHNLDMVYRLVKLFEKPHGIVINKDFADNNIIKEYCYNKKIKIISSIPYENKLGLLLSQGLIAAKEVPEYNELFNSILKEIGEVLK